MRTALVFVAALACANACGSSKPDPDEPTTAAEKQRREAGDEGDSNGKKWSGWRYQGDRNDCFYVVGRKCFKTEKAACNAAHCKSSAMCKAVGGGPATMTCDAGK